MAEFTKKTVVTQGTNGDKVVDISANVKATSAQTAQNVVYFILGVLEILLAFRLILKLTGASTASGFVRMIYTLTGIFVLPFEGIFRRAVSQGIETASVFEPSTAVALVVYLVIAWGIVKLISITSGEPTDE